MSLPTGPTPQALLSRVLLAAGALAAVAALTLAPRRFVAPARGIFMDAVSPLLGDWTYTDVESTLNALLFLPFGVALAMLVGRWWMLAMPAGFVLSFAVEVLQSRIPGRVPDLGDVLWNTVGAACGALIVGVVRGANGVVRRQARR
jgi:hypothetical protein